MTNEGTILQDFPTGKRIRKKKQKHPDEVSDWDSCEEDCKLSLPRTRPSTAMKIKEESSTEFSASEELSSADEELSTESRTRKVTNPKTATRKSVSKGRSKFECEFCHYSNWRQCAVVRHVNRNHPSQLTCGVCSFKARSLVLFKNHIETHPEDTGKLLIKEEKTEFFEGNWIKEEPNEDNWTKEEPNEDTEDRPGCEKEQDKKHRDNSPSNKPKAAAFKCKYCNYSSRQKCHVNRHTRERHLYKRRNGKYAGPLACDKCEYRTSSKQLIRQHVLRHTGEKPFRCKICNFRCTLKVNLQRHLRTHTGETPFACDICEYRCKQGFDLKKHMWTHTGEYPYACDLCDYRCSQNNVLKAHKKKRHLGKGINTRKYACDLCDFTSHVLKNLNSHLKTSHDVVLSKRSRKDTNQYKSEVTEYSEETLQDLENGEFVKIEVEDIKLEEEFEDEIKREEQEEDGFF